MLTESDKERFNDIVGGIEERRLLRVSAPTRDEEVVANILRKWEDRATEEHRLAVESRGETVGNKLQTSTSRSNNLREFPELDWIEDFNEV